MRGWHVNIILALLLFPGRFVPPMTHLQQNIVYKPFRIRGLRSYIIKRYVHIKSESYIIIIITSRSSHAMLQQYRHRRDIYSHVTAPIYPQLLVYTERVRHIIMVVLLSACSLDIILLLLYSCCVRL